MREPSSRRRVTRALLAALPLLLPGTARASGEAVPLDPFDLPPGATVTLTFSVTVDAALPPGVIAVANQGTLTGTNIAPLATDDPDDPTGSADPTLTAIDSADLAITKDDGQTTATPGDPITYTVVVSNSGPNHAVGATVADTFPAALSGVSWSCVASPGSSCTAGPTSGNIDDTVTVLAGGSVTYTVSATIDAAATGSLANTATVSAPLSTQDPVPSNNSATDTDSLTPEADLAISKSNGVSSVTAGDPVTYTITVSNAGPSDAAGATVSDPVPAALGSVSWTCIAAAGSSCTAGPVSGSINDTVTVLAGGNVTYTLTGTVDPGASGTLDNTATVTAPPGVTDPDSGNDSSSDSDAIARQADLSISKDDGVTAVTPGTAVTYTMVATNAGPSDAIGATVADAFPSVLTCSWSCTPAGGASCTAGPSSGDINDVVSLPAGDSVTYTASCMLSGTASGTLVNTATITAPGGVTDPASGNDSASDSDTIRGLDFGDAPDPRDATPGAYPTLLANGGARHGIDGTLHLGALVDGEADGQPSAAADGDDADGSDDEDGVALGPLVLCEDTDLTVTASAAGWLDAWVDFNADGDWADAGEQVFSSQAVVAGANALSLKVPCAAAAPLTTYARFRLSASGGLTPGGLAESGEVEDYAATLVPLDFGDAPDPSYPTLLASDGARHGVSGALHLGASIDAEPDGQPGAGAGGDDGNGSDDEDGVTFSSALFPGQNATVDVEASAGSGRLDAWIDFDGDGDWADAGEQIINDVALAAGLNGLVFAVPADAAAPLSTVARFRLSSAGGLGPSGFAVDGEVEDHAVDVAPLVDLAISKADDADPPAAGANLTYTITVANLGPGDASGVVVTDNLPAGVTLVATSGCVEDPGGAPTCTLGGIPAGSSASYSVEVSIDPSPPSSITNTATVSGKEHDPSPGNNSDSEQTTLDASAPAVAGIDTVAGTGDGQLAPCETARTAITQLLVRFSEPVAHAATTDPESATNPANYRLVRPASAASGIDTTSCAGGTGGDTVVGVDAVTYDGGTDTATLSLNGATALADGIHWLLVCGAIEDLAGNALDGGAGAGSDFIRGFRVDRRNLFADAHFDHYDRACGLTAWSSTSPTAVELVDADVDGSPLSGSAHNSHPTTGFDLEQCVPLVAGQGYQIKAAARVDTALGSFISFALRCRFHAAAGCGGSSAGSAALANAVGDTGGGFLLFAGSFTAPPGSASGRCGVATGSPLSGAFDVYVDDLFLGPSGLIFSDGFESGDTSAWSLRVP